MNVPPLITNVTQLIENIETLELYLVEGNESERLEAGMLIKKGICFVAYSHNKEIRFAPSRFIGYENNKLHKYGKIDGRKTNVAISAILSGYPVVDIDLETKYRSYCQSLGILEINDRGSFGVTRKFWLLNIETSLRGDVEISGEFPEGGIVERIHKGRERDSRVIKLAKRNFKELNGRLYCQICKFDFEKVYGELGKNFIEGHHTIAVSDMTPNHKTKPDEIAMLCSNCHRMVHKRRPWLSMDDMHKLIRKS